MTNAEWIDNEGAEIMRLLNEGAVCCAMDALCDVVREAKKRFELEVMERSALRDEVAADKARLDLLERTPFVNYVMRVGMTAPQVFGETGHYWQRGECRADTLRELADMLIAAENEVKP